MVVIKMYGGSSVFTIHDNEHNLKVIDVSVIRFIKVVA